MKKIWLMLFILLLAVAVISCGGEDAEPTPTTGTISGTLTLQAGMSGNLDNTQVAIYANYDDWNYMRVLKFTAASGGGSSATYTITDVTPGTYYLDAWKDLDNSGWFTAGDLFGVYGTTAWPGPTLAPLSVSAGQTATINVSMIVLQ